MRQRLHSIISICSTHKRDDSPQKWVSYLCTYDDVSASHPCTAVCYARSSQFAETYNLCVSASLIVLGIDQCKNPSEIKIDAWRQELRRHKRPRRSYLQPAWLSGCVLQEIDGRKSILCMLGQSHKRHVKNFLKQLPL